MRTFFFAWITTGALLLPLEAAVAQDAVLAPVTSAPSGASPGAAAQAEQASTPAITDSPATNGEPTPKAEPAAQSEVEELRRELAAMGTRISDLETQAALQDLEESQGSAAVELNEPRLSLYGFMDFGYDRWMLDGKGDDEVGVLRPTPAGSFVFGNLNVYFDANISSKWQTLFEIRFTQMPHGEELDLGPPIGTSYQRVNSTAFDYSSPSAQSQLRLGSIFIERAYTEWKPSDWFRLRAGQFLNPFGIWNVDHGTPTLIALSLPTFVAGQMMPGRLLGVQTLGAKAWGNKRLEYALHVSNGRTPLNFDLTDDKAVGGRLSFAWDWNSSSLVLGTSTYHGTYTDKHKVINLAEATAETSQNSSFSPEGYFDWKTVIAYREHVWAGDIRYTVGPFRLCAEGVARWVYYDKGKREPVYSEAGDVRYAPDRMEWDAYLIAAYRLPWRLEPYVMMEGANKSFVLPQFAGNGVWSAADRVLLAPSAGLNIRVTPQIMLKSQLQQVRGYDVAGMKFLWDAYAFYSRIVSSF